MAKSTEEVLQATNIGSPNTLMGYLKSGLLLARPERVRGPGGRGWTYRWPDSTVSRIRRIQELKAEGCRLKKIKLVLTQEATPAGSSSDGAPSRNRMPRGRAQRGHKLDSATRSPAVESGLAHRDGGNGTPEAVVSAVHAALCMDLAHLTQSKALVGVTVDIVAKSLNLIRKGFDTALLLSSERLLVVSESGALLSEIGSASGPVLVVRLLTYVDRVGAVDIVPAVDRTENVLRKIITDDLLP